MKRRCEDGARDMNLLVEILVRVQRWADVSTIAIFKVGSLL